MCLCIAGLKAIQEVDLPQLKMFQQVLFFVLNYWDVARTTTVVIFCATCALEWN